MGILNYAATISLDGYVANSEADFQWAAPSSEVITHHLERMTDVTTEILGRRAYSLLDAWTTVSDASEHSAAALEFAQRWQEIPKIVVSSTLSGSRFPKNGARLVRQLSLSDIRQIVAATQGIVQIFGPTTATEALRAGLVDRLELFVVPIMLGRGRRALPEGAYRKLTLKDHQVFGDGTFFLRYERA